MVYDREQKIQNYRYRRTKLISSQAFKDLLSRIRDLISK